jgi:hypothetical protein
MILHWKKTEDTDSAFVQYVTPMKIDGVQRHGRQPDSVSFTKRDLTTLYSWDDDKLKDYLHHLATALSQ